MKEKGQQNQPAVVKKTPVKSTEKKSPVKAEEKSPKKADELMLINIGIMNEQGERKQLQVKPCSKVKYILQKYLQVSEECAGDV